MKAGLARAESCCVNAKTKINAWHNSIVVWPLGRSSCSSPSNKEIHGKITYTSPSVVMNNNTREFVMQTVHIGTLITRPSFDQQYRFLNGPPTASFSYLFSLFKRQYNYASNVINYPSSIGCWDSNSRPLENKSPPITTLVGLPPNDKHYC